MRKRSKKNVNLYPHSPEAEIARDRIWDMEALSREKWIYKRIDRNARRILSETGVEDMSRLSLVESLNRCAFFLSVILLVFFY